MTDEILAAMEGALDKGLALEINNDLRAAIEKYKAQQSAMVDMGPVAWMSWFLYSDGVKEITKVHQGGSTWNGQTPLRTEPLVFATQLASVIRQRDKLLAALKCYSNYPEVKEYVGAIVYNRGLEAIARIEGEAG